MSKMTLKKWYGSSIHIPAFASYRYPAFAGSCMGIVNSLIKKYMTPVHVYFNGVESASADRPNGLININANYLIGEVKGRKLNAEMALTLINGLILHEAGHFAESPDDLSPFINFVKENTTCVFNKDIAARLGNIIEDIYIEAWIDRTVPTISWMLEEMNDFQFSLQDLEMVFDFVSEQESPPTTMVEVSNVLNILLVAKIFDSVNSTPYIEDMFLTIRTAVIASDLKQRQELCLALYDRIMPLMTEEECKNPNRDLMDALKRLIEGLTAPHEGEPDKEKTTAGRNAVLVINKLTEELSKHDITLISDVPVDGISSTTLFIESTPPLSSSGIESDSRYQRLAEVARQRAVVNRPYGEDRNRGNHIRKLYRIAIDNRIFAEPLALNLRKPMQVMIVVDCSSSMGGENITNACKAALGAANGFAEGRCDVSVFGHTADTLGGTEVILYRFKDFNEPISVLPYRLNSLLQRNGPRLCQNRDSYAIQYLSKKLRDTRKRRLMIVISDGAPQAHGYGGEPAILHTKSVVDSVRKEGIEVLSISIEMLASQVNNCVYGKENNVFNTDPNVIEEIVRKLIVN